MPSQFSSIVVAASAEKVWAAIRPFDSFAWANPDSSKPHMPTIIKNGKAADAVGAVREISLLGGAVVVETLLALSDRFDTVQGAFYTYKIDEAPFPVERYVATISVQKVSLNQSGPTADKCFVRWEASWSTPAGTEGANVPAQIQGLFDGSLIQLAKNFAAAAVVVGH